MKDKIIERCKKLLAMAKDSSSQHESEIAMRQLHALLAKHSIDISELEPEAVGTSEYFHKSYLTVWSRIVAMSVAELYFCKILYKVNNKRTREEYSFVGEELHRVIAKDITESIVTQLWKVSLGVAKDEHGKVSGKYRNSFLKGAAFQIRERCQALIEDAKKGQLTDGQGNTLPVLASIYDNNLARVQDYIDTLGTTTKATRTQSSNRHAYESGQKEGNRVNLRRSMDKVAPKQLGVG